MIASKRIAKSCILGLCILQAHAIAAPKSEDAPFRKEDNPSLSLAYPFARSKADSTGAEGPVATVEKGSAPAISIILARLDFMKRKASGKLPARPDRLIFTEPLKAWAVNPAFDSTRLRQPLLDICRMYEEMVN